MVDILVAVDKLGSERGHMFGTSFHRTSVSSIRRDRKIREATGTVEVNAVASAVSSTPAAITAAATVTHQRRQ